MKKPVIFFLILLIVTTFVLVLVVPRILDRYVYYTELDTSNFPLVQKWSSVLGENILELSATDDDSFVFARTAKTLYATDAETGQVLWHFPLAHQSVTVPAITKNGLVYIADARSIWALDQTTGDIVWSQPLSEPEGKVEAVTASLIIVNNRNTSVEGFDSKNGSLIWTFPLYWYHPKLYVNNGNKIYIPHNGLYMLEISSGKNALINEGDSIFDSVSHNNDIYYATLGSIVAINTKTETEIWRQKRLFSQNDFPRLDVFDQFILVEGAESLTMLNRETGDMIWKVPISYPMNPSVIGSDIFVMEGYERIIRVFQATTGKEIGKLKTSSYHFLLADSQRDMIAVGNKLIFSRGNELLCFIPKNQ